ncbi:hypothetical protein ABZ128_25885 [Streptomyces sp. NPDC006326]|uniref:hypothetical protein n=1 Tax=unclassified Streptomyces TaxID=2593676 RepID=UPI0033BB079A
MTADDIIEYRIAHLLERLAREDVAELGLRIEARGTHTLISGCVSSADTRAEILRIAREELAGLAWHEDLTVNRADPPGRAEELS